LEGAAGLSHRLSIHAGSDVMTTSYNNSNNASTGNSNGNSNAALLNSNSTRSLPQRLSSQQFNTGNGSANSLSSAGDCDVAMLPPQRLVRSSTGTQSLQSQYQQQQQQYQQQQLQRRGTLAHRPYRQQQQQYSDYEYNSSINSNCAIVMCDILSEDAAVAAARLAAVCSAHDAAVFAVPRAVRHPSDCASIDGSGGIVSATGAAAAGTLGRPLLRRGSSQAQATFSSANNLQQQQQQQQQQYRRPSLNSAAALHVPSSSRYSPLQQQHNNSAAAYRRAGGDTPLTTSLTTSLSTVSDVDTAATGSTAAATAGAASATGVSEFDGDSSSSAMVAVSTTPRSWSGNSGIASMRRHVASRAEQQQVSVMLCFCYQHHSTNYASHAK
jgi:hypothetical protein